MGTYSNKSLAGLCLIIGPIVGMVSWMLIGFVLGEGDTSQAAFQDALLGDWERIFGILPMLGFVAGLHGLLVLQSGIGSDENGHAFSLLGVRLWTFNIISGLVLIGLALAGQAALGHYVGTLGELLGSIGILLFALALSTRDDQNKIVQLIMAVVALIGTIAIVLYICDLRVDLALYDTILTPYYLVLTIWSVILGWNLLKK